MRESCRSRALISVDLPEKSPLQVHIYNLWAGIRRFDVYLGEPKHEVVEPGVIVQDALEHSLLGMALMQPRLANLFKFLEPV